MTDGDLIEGYELSSLLDRDGRDLMMDFRGPVNKSYEVAPRYAYETAMELDEVYESSISEPWELEYTSDIASVMITLKKRYDEVSDFAESRQVTIDPDNKVFISPVEDTGLEVEITGLMEISPSKIQAILD